MYEVRFTKEAKKDVVKLTSKLKQKLKQIIQTQIIPNPYEGKKLVGDLKGFFSLRLNYKDRIVYTVDESQKIVYIHRVKTHYGD